MGSLMVNCFGLFIMFSLLLDGRTFGGDIPVNPCQSGTQQTNGECNVIIVHYVNRNGMLRKNLAI